MSQYIVCKVRNDGTMVGGTPPVVHTDFEVAKAEAERLAASVPDAQHFLIFKAHAKSQRTMAPVETRFLS